MELVSKKKLSKEELDLEEFGYKLERAIGSVHYLSCSLPGYPHEISKKEISGITSILDDIQDELENIHKGVFQKDGAGPR